MPYRLKPRLRGRHLLAIIATVVFAMALPWIVFPIAKGSSGTEATEFTLGTKDFGWEEPWAPYDDPDGKLMCVPNEDSLITKVWRCNATDIVSFVYHTPPDKTAGFRRLRTAMLRDAFILKPNDNLAIYTSGDNAFVSASFEQDFAIMAVEGKGKHEDQTMIVLVAGLYWIDTFQSIWNSLTDHQQLPPEIQEMLEIDTTDQPGLSPYLEGDLEKLEVTDRVPEPESAEAGDTGQANKGQQSDNAQDPSNQAPTQRDAEETV